MLSAVEPAAFPLELSSRALLASRRRSAPSWPCAAERYCSPSRSCARCATSSASGGTYAAHSVDCSTDAAAVQPSASRWCDNLERELEREPACGPRRTFRGRSPTRGSRTRSRMCRRCRLPKHRSPRRNFRMASTGCSSCAPGCCPARRSPSGRVGSRPPGPDQGALARAPTRPAPSALPRSAFAVPARTALRACAPLAILTVPACSLGRRTTAETASAADAGPGGRGSV